MSVLLKLLTESMRMAWHALVVNKLRTILSLLGITIGIIAIISVFTLVDSMERNIRTNVQSLGDNTVYVQKWPWATGSDYEWWKFWQRPQPTLREAEALRKRCTSAEAVVFMASKSSPVEHGARSLENVGVLAVTEGYERIKSFGIGNGRFFSQMESNSGRPVCVIGAAVAQGLFGSVNPVGLQVKVLGRRLTVIGVFEIEGESIFGNSVDGQVVIPVSYARQLLRLDRNSLNPTIIVRGRPNVTTAELKDDLRGHMRSIRKIRPQADDTFALNEISVLSSSLDGIFTVINLAGAVIGGFSILVGGFGIANIMFVSVRERTNLIGIEKSLGAKNWFIMVEFLSEAVFLSLLGGLVGLLLVFLGSVAVSKLMDVDLYLTAANMVKGMVISVTIGLVAGVVPAWSASRLNPVDAIRSK
jgi:putative ABC transport system permease protein